MDSYYEGAVTQMAAPASRLTGADRDLIDQARALAAAAGHDEIRKQLADRGLIKPGYEGGIFPFSFGVARGLLRDLADLAERLGGGDA